MKDDERELARMLRNWLTNTGLMAYNQSHNYIKKKENKRRIL